ncbi:hypothetical protein J2Z49_002977 [Desulfofundulus luciae]|uniref:SLH domain-containing protein n=1 Tax=Desulfofundulus luciae TaxID=74702 RepID=A0ABU0B6E3_9FIRM|nr:S-layer homology domain-containing protein [Desulfofundulus luciae]MDQ0287844.1 hypothetical protein [Desulfofundulus luciae]
MRGKTVLVVMLALLFVLAAAGVAAAQNAGEIPPLPAAYYGSVNNTAGQPVESGTVEAYIGGKKCGQIDISRGLYGGPGGFDPKLVVAGTADDQGRPVDFMVVVNGTAYMAHASPAVTWTSGDVRQVNLTVDLNAGSGSGSLGSSGGTSSSSGTGGSSGSGGSGDSGGSSSSDTIAPALLSSNPGSGAAGVAVDETFTLTFDEDLAADSVQAEFIVQATKQAVAASASVDGRVLKVKPSAALAYDTGYTLQVTVKDRAGNKKEVAVDFRTAAKPAAGTGSSSGPGGGTVGTQPADGQKPSITAEFKDMQGHWAAETVSKLAGMGVIGGYEDGTFRPNNKITRAEIASILARALKLQPVDETALNYADKNAIPAWARGAVAAAAEEGILKGYPVQGGVAFKAGNPVTRVELAAILSRVLEARQGAVTGQAAKFTDAAAIPAWAKNAVNTAAASGIVGGYPDGSFKPGSSVTRAEASAMILRLLEKLNG